MRKIILLILFIIILVNCNGTNPIVPNNIPEGFVILSMIDPLSGSRQIFKMDTNGKNLYQVLPIPYNINSIRISPNGQNISYNFDPLPYDSENLKAIQVLNIESQKIIFSGEEEYYYLEGWDCQGKNVITSNGFNVNIVNIYTKCKYKTNIPGILQSYRYPNTIAVSKPDITGSVTKVYHFTIGENDTTYLTTLPYASYYNHFSWSHNLVVSVIHKEFAKSDIILYDFKNSKIIKRYEFIIFSRIPKWSNDENYFTIIGNDPLYTGENEENFIYVYDKKGILSGIYKPGYGIYDADLYITGYNRYCWDLK